MGVASRARQRAAVEEEEGDKGLGRVENKWPRRNESSRNCASDKGIGERVHPRQRVRQEWETKVTCCVAVYWKTAR